MLEALGPRPRTSAMITPKPRDTAAALVVAAALAVVWTWPLASHMASRVPHDPGDPILVTWILWWNAHVVPLTDRWWDPPIFVPLRGAITLSEHFLGVSAFATPLQLVGLEPLTAYNMMLLLSYALSALFAWLLGYRLTGSVAAGACAALTFGFGPYRASHVPHLQVLTSQWMPVMLLGMHAYVDTGRRRWLALFGLSWVLQALSNGYYMLFLPALIVPWLVWFTPWRTAPRTALPLVLVWIGSSLLLLPVLYGYYLTHESLGIGRSLEDIRQYSATPGSFVRPHPLLALWPAGRGTSAEDHLFPGLVAVVLAGLGAAAALAGFARSRRDAEPRLRQPDRAAWNILFYAAAAVLMFALALGPGGEQNGPASMWRPYTWLLWLPGYDQLRVPARFAMPGTLCLALAAACSVGWWLRSGGRLRTAVATIAVAAIGLEGLPERLPMFMPPQKLMLADAPPEAAVVEIPPDDGDVRAASMYRAIFHERPLVNGYSGYTPYHHAVLSLSLRRRDTSVLRYLARERPLVIVVSRIADRSGRFRRMVEAMSDASLLNSSGAGPIYLLPRQPQPPVTPPASPLPCRALGIDARRLRMDCGEPRPLTAIEFAVRGRYREVDERMLIEASDDGEQWREVWLGWTGEFVLDAVLRDFRLVPVRIPLPVTRARYLRIYPAREWMPGEVKVLGE
jgi:hypothetical protein